MRVPFEKITLDNRLDVIVHEDHHVPLVAVCVWYHVGSKNEQVGRTGFAHLFEHLMFEGSAHQSRGYFEPLQEAGAALNGSTGPDRTNYWEVVPRDAARLALWMEADRMGWLLPVLSAGRFETQRAVVLNERRQSYENRPYGRARFALLDALFPGEHPYHWPTIGRTADLKTATVEDAHDFFRRFYHPANASIAICGDIATDRAFDLVREFFGELPAGPPPDSVRPPDPDPEPVRLVLEDRVELPRLYLAWSSPRLFGPGDAELDVAAEVLGNGRTSRLYRRLIHDRRLATELAVSQASRELAGTLQVLVTAAPGQNLADLESAVLEEVRGLAADGPHETELERVRAQIEASFDFRTESLGGFGGKADQLNAYNTYSGTPDWFDEDLARYLTADAGQVASALARCATREPAVRLSVVPTGARHLALAGSQPVPEDL